VYGSIAFLMREAAYRSTRTRAAKYTRFRWWKGERPGQARP